MGQSVGQCSVSGSVHRSVGQWVSLGSDVTPVPDVDVCGDGCTDDVLGGSCIIVHIVEYLEMYRNTDC